MKIAREEVARTGLQIVEKERQVEILIEKDAKFEPKIELAKIKFQNLKTELDSLGKVGGVKEGGLSADDSE